MSPSKPLEIWDKTGQRIRSRNIRGYLKRHAKATTLAKKYEDKLRSLEPLRERVRSSQEAANIAWRTLNGGQQAAVRQLLGLPVVTTGPWKTDETAVETAFKAIIRKEIRP